jgi:hypothetical protein
MGGTALLMGSGKPSALAGEMTGGRRCPADCRSAEQRAGQADLYQPPAEAGRIIAGAHRGVRPVSRPESLRTINSKVDLNWSRFSCTSIEIFKPER